MLMHGRVGTGVNQTLSPTEVELDVFSAKYIIGLDGC